MGKVLIALIVLVVAAVAFVWVRTPRPTAAPLAKTEAPSATPAPSSPPSSQHEERARPSPPAAAPSEGAGPINLQINSEADLLAAMGSLGIEDLDMRMTNWALSRGYPEFDEAGNYLLDQPYQQYDEETLRGLAQADDMWAQQLLAQQLAAKDPEEALEWYHRAATNGSVYAMQEMARLYYRMTNELKSAGEGTPTAAESGDAAASASPEVEAYAWLAAAERSGWDATRGASLIPLLGRKLSQEQVTQACDLAESLRSEMSSERSARGLMPFDRTPPPIVYPADEMGAATQCHADESKAFDMSGCREADVQTGTVSTRVWVCTPQG